MPPKPDSAKKKPDVKPPPGKPGAKKGEVVEQPYVNEEEEKLMSESAAAVRLQKRQKELDDEEMQVQENDRKDVETFTAGDIQHIIMVSACFCPCTTTSLRFNSQPSFFYPHSLNFPFIT
jgi:hypothetical protein